MLNCIVINAELQTHIQDVRLLCNPEICLERKKYTPRIMRILIMAFDLIKGIARCPKLINFWIQFKCSKTKLTLVPNN